MGFDWPTIFRDAFEFVRNCDRCQRAAGRKQLTALPLHLVIGIVPFSKWGLDFIGPISPPSSAGHIFILTATDSFTRWAEAVPLKNAKAEQVVLFLQENIFFPFRIATLTLLKYRPGVLIPRDRLRLVIHQ
jgi:hypothetical protein